MTLKIKSLDRSRLIEASPESVAEGVVRVSVKLADPHNLVQNTRVFFGVVSKTEPRLLPTRTVAREIITSEPPRILCA